MKAIIIKRDFKLIFEKKNDYLKKNNLYIFSEDELLQFSKLVNRDFYEIKELEEVFCTLIKSKTIFIHRSGGIGDIIALSSLCNYLDSKEYYLIFSTQKRYHAIFEWFLPKIRLHYPEKSLISYDLKYKLNKNISQLNFECEIEKYNKNWFELFFKDFSDIDFNELGRPKLKNERILNVPKQIKNGILLCLQATAWIRSISFPDIYFSLPKTDKNIYIHENTLNEVELKFIDKLNDKKIKLIKANNLRQYLCDVYDADQVICTDTGALHFREAINKKALGIYAPFTSECRCKYYKYVKTIDIKSKCLYQPCFKHCFKANEKCQNDIGLKYYAPCLNSIYNKSLKGQLKDFFIKNL